MGAKQEKKNPNKNKIKKIINELKKNNLIKPKNSIKQNKQIFQLTKNRSQINKIKNN